jgi:hypothetical protein
MSPCPDCPRTFGSPSALQAHWAAKHRCAPAIACPYCSAGATFLASSAQLYASGKNYGPMWACLPCKAWVGCHPHGRKPLGRLANAELRAAKQRAHADFDPIWRRGYVSRSEAYRYLAERMALRRQQTHIGMFDVEQCRLVVTIMQTLGPELSMRSRPPKATQIMRDFMHEGAGPDAGIGA